MHDMTKLKNMVCDELDKIADRGLTSGNIEMVYKLVDIKKDIVTTEAMEEDNYSNRRGYSRANYPMYENGYAHEGATYEDGNSYARRNYSRNGYSNDGYSMASDEMIDKMERIFKESGMPEHERRKYMAQIKGM